MSVFTNPASRSAEQAAAYTAAVLELLGLRNPIEALQETVSALEQVRHGLSTEQVEQPEAPGKWSVRDVLQHLADSELVWGYRIRMVLAQDRPVLTGYDQDLWAERLRYRHAAAHDALDTFGSIRRANLRLVEGATPADRARVGLHAERG